ncbi:MAG: hypothetical protein ACKOXB_11885 [Flavobacteriales bacterium]
MTKILLRFIFTSVFLATLQMTLSYSFDQLGCRLFWVSHLFLFIITLLSVLSILYLPRIVKILPGQVFLIQSVTKIILAGSFILFVLKTQGKLANTHYLLFFVAVYFLYLSTEIAVLLQWIKSQK